MSTMFDGIVRPAPLPTVQFRDCDGGVLPGGAETERHVSSGSLGIVCPVCGVNLKVLQGRVQVSWLLAFVVPIAVALLVGCVIPLDSGAVSAKATLIALAAFYFGGFALHGHYSPRLLTLRFLRDGETVEYPLVMRARELAAEAKLSEEQLELESPDLDKPAWTCAKCREENPGNFDICWKCQAARPEAS
jgi:hypothetical protein